MDYKKYGEGISAGTACILVYEKGLGDKDHSFWTWLRENGFHGWGAHGNYGLNWVFVNLNSLTFAPGMPGIKITSTIREHAITVGEFKTIWNIYGKYEGNTTLEMMDADPSIFDKMIHRWQFDDIRQYFDYNTNAIQIFSEEIGKLPEEQIKKVYDDISQRIRKWLANYNGKEDDLKDILCGIMIDLYRAMKTKLTVFTDVQEKYLEHTAKVIVDTLKEKRISVNLFTNDVFDNTPPHPYLTKLRFEVLCKACGFFVHQTILPDDRTKENVISHAYMQCRSYRWCVVIIPDAIKEDFMPLIDRVKKQPAMMNIVKWAEAPETEFEILPYVSIKVREEREEARRNYRFKWSPIIQTSANGSNIQSSEMKAFAIKFCFEPEFREPLIKLNQYLSRLSPKATSVAIYLLMLDNLFKVAREHAAVFIPVADCEANKYYTVPGTVDTSLGRCYVICTNSVEAAKCPHKFGLVYDLHALLIEAVEKDDLRGICINPYGENPCLVPREVIIERYINQEKSPTDEVDSNSAEEKNTDVQKDERELVHAWRFNEVWKYFDYNTDAIYTYSEQIAKLPKAEQERVYADISNWIQCFFEYFRGPDQKLQELVGCIVNDLYRTMNKATYFTGKQATYLENTAKVLANTLKKQGIVVHFGSNNCFEHPNIDLVVEAFKAFWNSCGFELYQLITNGQETKETILAKAAARCKTTEWCALMFPNGGDREFEPMTVTIEQPGVMNFFKANDAESSKYNIFPYVSIRAASQRASASIELECERPEFFSAEKKNKELESLKAQYMKSAGYLIDVLYPAYTKLAIEEKGIYDSMIGRKTKARNVLKAFITLQDRTKEAVRVLPESLITGTETDKIFCSLVLSVNLLFIGMVNGRVNVLEEYIQNGISKKAKELNIQAREYCKKFDEQMPSLIEETHKREDSWCGIE